MADFTKSKGPAPVVRQARGPGMNLGLKKPRQGFKKGNPDDTKSGPKKRKSDALLEALLKGPKTKPKT